jgi:hypothetical protein
MVNSTSYPFSISCLKALKAISPPLFSQYTPTKNSFHIFGVSNRNSFNVGVISKFAPYGITLTE